MGYTSTLETCSVEVRKGVEWLKSNVDMGKVNAEDAEVFYVLKQFDQELVEKYLERAEEKSFWESDVLGEIHLRGHGWFLAKLGLDDNPFYIPGLSKTKK